MVKILFDLHYNPKDFSRTVPVVIPCSYQRQYITFGEPIERLEDTLPQYMPLIIECTKLRDQSLERQHMAGEDKYLLQYVHQIKEFVQHTLLQKDGFIDRNLNSGSKRLKAAIANGARTALESMHSGPIIEELEE